MRKLITLAILVLPVIAWAGTPEPATQDDYPTAARADYVFACMTVNGETHDALERCSCAIDVVASILPYKDYVSADTVLRMQLEKSVLAMEFHTATADLMVRRLHEAEAEGEVRCF
ncbi:MAG: hypothetical protein ACREFY_10910 [Acetobacteraceae bacterium]